MYVFGNSIMTTLGTKEANLGYIEDELQQNENISECLKVQK